MTHHATGALKISIFPFHANSAHIFTFLLPKEVLSPKLSFDLRQHITLRLNPNVVFALWTLSPPPQCSVLHLIFYLFRNKGVSNSFSASAVSVPPMSTPTAVLNFISLDGGKYNVSWMFNSTMDTFHFVVKVRATGWIGFGLATRAPNGMNGYDVAVCGTNNETNNGTKYLKVT